MNGEVKSYRLNDPMKWAEFKTMPDDVKIMYIKALKQKWNVPSIYIARMLGVSDSCIFNEITRLGIASGKSTKGLRRNWDKEGFLAWCNGAPIPAADPTEETTETVEQSVDEAQETERQIASLEEICDPVPVPVPEIKVLPVDKEKNKAIPDSGSMTFEGSVESILNTLSVLLGGANAHISITWDVLSDDAG